MRRLYIIIGQIKAQTKQNKQIRKHTKTLHNTSTRRYGFPATNKELYYTLRIIIIIVIVTIIHYSDFFSVFYENDTHHVLTCSPINNTTQHSQYSLRIRKIKSRNHHSIDCYTIWHHQHQQPPSQRTYIQSSLCFVSDLNKTYLCLFPHIHALPFKKYKTKRL